MQPCWVSRNSAVNQPGIAFHMISTTSLTKVPEPVRSAPDVTDGDGSDWRFLSHVVNGVYNSHGSVAAIETIGAAIEASPADGNLKTILGQVLLASGRHAEALAALSTAMRNGTEVEILHLVAEAIFPGPRYSDHLLSLHKWLRPATYLEIGVFKGETLALAQPDTCVTGIDPQPRPEADRHYIAPTCIHSMTSDAYFASLDSSGARPPGVIDLAFIDGLHIYEQILRDFINVERYCGSGSVIVLHDTLPIAAVTTARQRRSGYWCGDVWKIRPCLQKYRPDLLMLTIPLLRISHRCCRVWRRPPVLAISPMIWTPSGHGWQPPLRGRTYRWRIE
jgi:Methyltransferase domain